jgi:hypothetical protein
MMNGSRRPPRQPRHPAAPASAALIILCLLASCTVPYRIDRRTGPTLQSVDPSAKLLKVHMRNGDVYLLYSWTIDGAQLIGRGEHRGPDRVRLPVETIYQLALDDIAIYETDTKIASPVGTGMKILAVTSGVLSVVITAVVTAYLYAIVEYSY